MPDTETSPAALAVAPVADCAKLSITAIILTFNEEAHIERCIDRISGLVQRIVVVDSFSTDKTVEIAKRLGVEALQRTFKNYADQFQWGLTTICPKTDWVLRIDADEYIEEGAQDELRRSLPKMDANVTGFEFKLKVIFQGRWLRHGRYYSAVLLRLWRTGVGQIEQRWMDEHIVLSHGRAERIFGGDLVDHNLKDITFWIDKHNRYATRHMVDFINREYRLFDEDERIKNTDAAARRKRFLKNSIFARAPMYLRAFLFYIYRYFFRLSFLDGKEGLVFHFMHGCWVYLLIDAKIAEARAFIKAHGLAAFKEHLKSRHNIDLDAARPGDER